MKGLFLGFFLLLGFSGTAQLQPYNKAMIWRGFTHKWTYNHRCNRIGDYVVYNDGKPQSVHVSATGLGQDSTYFKSYYTYIETPDVAFKEGKISVKIENKEKQLTEGSVLVSIPADEWMRDKGNYESLINGFDLRSDEAADKIQLMRLSIEDPNYLPNTKELQFTVHFNLVLDCQSVECPSSDNKVNYTLDVYYLLMGLEEYNTNSTEKFFTRSYSWDKKADVNERPEEKMIDGIAMPIFNYATVGIKAFSVVLNKAHWLLQFNNSFTPIKYDPQTGDMKLSVDLLFKEWQEGMKGNLVMPKQSKFAEKRKGWVVMDSDALLLQMKEAEINYMKRHGRMFWRGYNKKPERDDAVNVAEIALH